LATFSGQSIGPEDFFNHTVEALGKAISSLTNYFPKKEGFF